MSKGRIITALAAMLAIPAMAAPAGYFQVPGTETTLKIYGYAQVDGVYDMDGNYGIDNGMNPTNWVHESTVQDNQWHWRSKARFGFTSTTPSALGDVMMKIEFQASDTATAGGKAVNVRHAYGKIGNLTIGNTDSIFADWDASANYLDNDGPLYDFYGNSRVNQVSYAYSFTEGLTGQFAIEQDKSGSNDKYFPGSLVAALGYTADWGHVRGSVAFSKHKVHTDAAPATTVAEMDPVTGVITVTPVAAVAESDDSKSTVSWGLGANYTIGKGNITAQVFEGVGFYGIDYTDRFDTDANGDLDVQKVLAWNIGYSHAVTDTVTVAGGFGESKWKEDKELEPETLTVTSFFLNCQWQATKTASFGIEYFHSTGKYADTEGFTKDNGETTDKAKENRINVRAKFNMF